MNVTAKQKRRFIIALLVGCLFGVMLGLLLFKAVPTENADILKVTVGFLGGAFTTMVSYYFGDSEGPGE
jgi:hypothetical protein